MITWTWIFAGAFAGLAGVFLAAVTQIQPELGFEPPAADLRGGRPRRDRRRVRRVGAGGILLGLVVEWSGLYIASGMKVAVAFVVLILVLIVRPQGIFGKARAI